MSPGHAWDGLLQVPPSLQRGLEQAPEVTAPRGNASEPGRRGGPGAAQPRTEPVRQVPGRLQRGSETAQGGVPRLVGGFV